MEIKVDLDVLINTTRMEDNHVRGAIQSFFNETGRSICDYLNDKRDYFVKHESAGFESIKEKPFIFFIRFNRTINAFEVIAIKEAE